MPRAPAAVRTIPGTNRPWPLDKRGQPWPRSRFGQPLRPLDEYPLGVRAPGEGYTGPIADPDEAMRATLAFKDVLAQAARYAADPDAPIRAYLSAMEVWKSPARYAGYTRPEPVTPVRMPEASAPSPAPLHAASSPKRDGAASDPGVTISAPAPAIASGTGPTERPDLATIRARYQTADDRMVTYRPLVGSTPIPGLDRTSIPVLKGERMTATEAKMLDELSPYRLFWLQDVKQRALGESENRVPTPDDVVYPSGITTDRQKRFWLNNDGRRDAFRHAFWNAMMARGLGQTWAEQLATAHEGVPGNPGAREAMDLYNNSVGRRIAAEHPGANDHELARRVEEASRKGELIVLDEKGELQWSDRVPLWRHGLSGEAPDGGGQPVPAGDAPARSR